MYNDVFCGLFLSVNIFKLTKKQNKTKQNKTKQNKTKQNKTKQNKTKQNKIKTKQKQNKKKKKTHTQKKKKKKHQRHPYIMWISSFYSVTVLTYRHTRKNVVRKLKFKIWQYVIFFHANWLVFFIFNFIKISIV